VRARGGKNLQPPQIQKFLCLFFFHFPRGKAPDLLSRTPRTLFSFFSSSGPETPILSLSTQGNVLTCCLPTYNDGSANFHPHCLTFSTMFVGWPVSFLGPSCLMKLGRPPAEKSKQKNVRSLLQKNPVLIGLFEKLISTIPRYLI